MELEHSKLGLGFTPVQARRRQRALGTGGKRFPPVGGRARPRSTPSRRARGKTAAGPAALPGPAAPIWLWQVKGCGGRFWPIIKDMKKGRGNNKGLQFLESLQKDVRSQGFEVQAGKVAIHQISVMFLHAGHGLQCLGNEYKT